MKAKNYFTTKRISFLATFVALVTVATLVIQIPPLGGSGYINVGDTLIFVCAVFFDPFFAFVAGGLGSAIADVFVGYAAYAPFTFVVKGIEGLLCSFLIKALKKIRFKNVFAFAISMLISGLWMTVGYFFTDCVLYSFATAVAGWPGNFLQCGVSVVLGFALGITMSNIKGIRNVLSIEKGEN